MKKIVKIVGMYALITGYCYYLTDQMVIITDPKDGGDSEKYEWVFPWKLIINNLKTFVKNISWFIKT